MSWWKNLMHSVAIINRTVSTEQYRYNPVKGSDWRLGSIGSTLGEVLFSGPYIEKTCQPLCSVTDSIRQVFFRPKRVGRFLPVAFSRGRTRHNTIIHLQRCWFGAKKISFTYKWAKPASANRDTSLIECRKNGLLIFVSLVNLRRKSVILSFAKTQQNHQFYLHTWSSQFFSRTYSTLFRETIKFNTSTLGNTHLEMSWRNN